MCFYRILRNFAFAAFAAQKFVIAADKHMSLFVEIPCLQEGLFHIVVVAVEFGSIDCTVDFVVAGSLQDEIGVIVVHFLAHNPIDFLLLIDIFVPTLAVVPAVETAAAVGAVGTTMIEVECFAHSIAIAVWHSTDHFADFVAPLGTRLLTYLSLASMNGILRKLTVMWKALGEQGNSTTTHQQHHKNFPTVTAAVVAVAVRIAGFAAGMLLLAENCNSFDSTLKNRRRKKMHYENAQNKNRLCDHTWK